MVFVNIAAAVSCGLWITATTYAVLPSALRVAYKITDQREHSN